MLKIECLLLLLFYMCILTRDNSFLFEALFFF